MRGKKDHKPSYDLREERCIVLIYISLSLRSSRFVGKTSLTATRDLCNLPCNFGEFSLSMLWNFEQLPDNANTEHTMAKSSFIKLRFNRKHKLN